LTQGTIEAVGSITGGSITSTGNISTFSGNIQTIQGTITGTDGSYIDFTIANTNFKRTDFI
ncbi:MAG: hypothetical protein ACKPKO_61580, partial [Candidatus Fonsibacter sp.]